MKWQEEVMGWPTCQVAFLRMVVWPNVNGKFYWEVKCAGFVLATGVALDKEIGKAAAEVALVDLTQQLVGAVKS